MTDPTRKTLLLVEDDVIIAQAQKGALEGCGYRVLVEYSAGEAVRTAREREDIDLILMDIDLGEGMDGTEAARLILAHREIPVVFLSGHTEPNVVEKTARAVSYGYVVKTSGLAVLNASIGMAFRLFESNRTVRRQKEELEAANEEYEAQNEELQLSETELERSRALLEAAIEQSPSGIIIADAPDVTIRMVNPAALAIRGEESAGLTGIPVQEHSRRWNIFQPDGSVFPPERLPLSRAVLYGETVREEEAIIRDSHGRDRLISSNAAPIRDGSGQIRAGIVIFTDITERRLAEDQKEAALAALVESETQLRSLIDAAPFGAHIYELREGYRLVFCGFNAAAERILGVGHSQFLEKTIEEAFPALEKTPIPEEYRRVASTGVPFFTEQVEYDEQGIRGAYDVHALSLGKHRIAAFFMDVTERRRAEEAVRQQLAEKELLLKEVHHRIKNNITVIESLLSIQAQSAGSEETKVHLYEAMSRIASMRIIYDRLLQTDEFTEVSVRKYLEDLVASIVDFHPGGERFKVSCEIADVRFKARALFPLGIIVNELLTNSIKHGFSGRDSGQITLSLQSDGKEITLEFRDDGIGLPDGFDLESRSGFGLTLVKLQARQLNGSFSLYCDGGVRCVVTFRNP